MSCEALTANPPMTREPAVAFAIPFPQLMAVKAEAEACPGPSVLFGKPRGFACGSILAGQGRR